MPQIGHRVVPHIVGRQAWSARETRRGDRSVDKVQADPAAPILPDECASLPANLPGYGDDVERIEEGFRVGLLPRPHPSDYLDDRQRRATWNPVRTQLLDPAARVLPPPEKPNDQVGIEKRPRPSHGLRAGAPGLSLTPAGG